MAWTATLVGLGKRANNEGAQVFTIVYSDGQSKLQRDYARLSFSLASLRAVARDEVRKLEVEPPVVDTTGVVVGVAIDLTPPAETPPIPPAKDEADLAAFLVAYQTVQRLSRAVQAGLVAADAKTITDARAALLALSKPEYLELL